MKKLIMLALLLGSCDVCIPEADQKLRRELFKECMSIIPKGPEKAHYNDWSEVIAECGSQAYWMSKNKNHCEDAK